MLATPRQALLALLVALVVGSATSAVHAQPFLYALSETGTLTVNGTVLNNLSGGSGDQLWWELFVLGSDRYALRTDGRISRNGAGHLNLDFDSLDLGAWVGLAVTEEAVWALRTDGLLNKDSVTVIQYVDSNGEHFFAELVTDGVSTYALRSDGALFRDLIAEPLFTFMAGPGLGGAGEGEAPDTVWVDVALSPIDGAPHALRRDGKLVRGELVPPAEGEISNGTIIANLPFDVQVITPAASYMDIAFGDDGNWFVVRADGSIFNQDNQFKPIIDLPGDPNSSGNQTHMEAVGFGKGFLIVRRDGRLYDASETGSLLDLKGARYRNIALSDDPPDLTNFKNAKPQLARYLVKTVTGESVTFPIEATDTDKESADLVITVNPDDLPEGSTFDQVTRMFNWPSAGPKGTYKLRVQIDDGIAKPVKKKVSIRVNDPDDNVDKNRKPQATKIKAARALVSRPIELPILATDRDGDVLTITPDLTKEPYLSKGALFDALTNTFTWTPALGDIATYTLRFTIEDGTAKRVLKVKLKVVSSLLSL